MRSPVPGGSHHGGGAALLHRRVVEVLAALRREGLGAEALAIGRLMGVPLDEAEQALRELVSLQGSEIQRRSDGGRSAFCLHGADLWSLLEDMSVGALAEIRGRWRV